MRGALEPTGTQVPVERVIPAEDNAEYVAPLVHRYFEQRVNPMWENAQRSVRIASRSQPQEQSIARQLDHLGNFMGGAEAGATMSLVHNINMNHPIMSNIDSLLRALPDDRHGAQAKADLTALRNMLDNDRMSREVFR